MNKLVENLITNKASASAIGGIGIAIGLAAGMAVDDPPTRVDIARAEMREQPTDGFDLARYTRTIDELRAADSTIVDVLSLPVAAGEEVTTGVSMPEGSRLLEGATVLGEAFTVLASGCVKREAGAWCSVRARNDSGKFARLAAIIRVTPP